MILGVGIATDVPNIRAEFEACGVPFEKRVGRMLEGLQLARALWSGEPVKWSGRWQVAESVLGPEPVQKGGPPIWAGGSVTPALKRIARHFDGWFPIDTPPAQWAERRAEISAFATTEGREPEAIAGALYLTLSINEDAEQAGARLDEFLASYYGARPDVLKKRQACYAGPAEGAAKLMQAYADAGVEHFCLRFAGDHEAALETFAKVRRDLGW